MWPDDRFLYDVTSVLEQFDGPEAQRPDRAQARRLVQDLRRASKNRELKVMVGGSLFDCRPDLVKRVDADGYAPDAPSAARLAAQLL